MKRDEANFLRFMNDALAGPLERQALQSLANSSHERKLLQAKAFLESIKHDHPEWGVRRKPD